MHVQDDLNLHILGVLKGTVLLNAALLFCCFWRSKLSQSLISQSDMAKREITMMIKCL